MKKTILTRILAAMLALSIAFSVVAYGVDQASSLIALSDLTEVEKYEKVWELYKKFTLYNRSDAEVLDATMKQLLVSHPDLYPIVVDSLAKSGDPYGGYYTAEQVGAMFTSSSFSGIGCAVDSTANGIVVTEVFKGSPAERAGIRALDIFVEVDGVDMSRSSQSDMVDAIRGEPGTAVQVGVLRPGIDSILRFNIVRAVISQTAVHIQYETVGETVIPYLVVDHFDTSEVYIEFIKALAEIKSKGYSEIVIDMRNNHGGEFTTCMEMIDFLITEPGKTICTVTVPKSEAKTQVFETTAVGIAFDQVVVLINEKTVSSAELFAVSLQENDAAILVGAKTFGKAVGQTYYEFDQGDLLGITSFEITSPKGNAYNGVGVFPDLEVKNLNVPLTLPPFGSLNNKNFVEVYMGNSADAVAALENRLVYLGYMTHPDNVFDDYTRRALAAYQKDNRLEATGTFNFATLEMLTNHLNALKEQVVELDKQKETAFEYILTHRGTASNAA